MLIIETVPTSAGSTAVRSIISAGAVKKCFDLGIPCYLHDDFVEDVTHYESYQHLDLVAQSDGGYRFAFGDTNITATSLDEPLMIDTTV